MRAPLPPRRWRKLVAATQGVVLTVAAAGVLPLALTQALLLAALALLTASMGECTWWLWRRGHAAPARTAARRRRRDGHGARPAARWAALVAPHQPSDLNLGSFARLPVELLIVVAVGRPAARPPAPRAGRGPRNGPERARAREDPRHRVLHGVRPPVQAARRFELRGDRIETLGEAIGTSAANLAAAAAAVLIIAILAIPVLACCG